MASTTKKEKTETTAKTKQKDVSQKKTTKKPASTNKKTTTATKKAVAVKEKTEKIKTEKLPEVTVVNKKKIVFLGSEAAPFIATGGLADVMGSLPKALAKNPNNEVSVILPLYSNVNGDFRKEVITLTSVQ